MKYEIMCLKKQFDIENLEICFRDLFKHADTVFHFRKFDEVKDAIRLYLRVLARYAVHPIPCSSTAAELKAAVDFCGMDQERTNTFIGTARLAFHSCWEKFFPKSPILDFEFWQYETIDAVNEARRLKAVDCE